MEGVGKKVFPDGSNFQGQWLDGAMHGNGKMTFPDGKVFIGVWENNEWKSNFPQNKEADLQIKATKIPKISSLIVEFQTIIC